MGNYGTKLTIFLQVDLILPVELYNLMWKDVETRIADVRYSRVMMTLSDVLEGDFFNTYIKTGTIILFLSSRNVSGVFSSRFC